MKLSIILFAAFISGCASSHINDRRINAQAFPPDFSDPNHILLIEKWTHGLTQGTVNRRLQRSFRKSYSGKFELASRKQIEADPRYSDKNIYKYILTSEVWSSRSTTVTTTTNYSNTTSSTGIQYNNAYRLDFHLYDRANGQNYPDIGVSSNSFPKAIKRVSVVANKKLRKS